MAKPNFGFQKRQKEQARERKKQEKLARKAERANARVEPEADEQPAQETGTDQGSLPVTPEA